MKNLSAIYAIRHISTNRYYVGSAVDVYGRWKGHRSLLNLGKHYNQYLQNAWKKYGPEEFEWLLLESVEDVNLLLKREQKWIDSLEATDRKKGFNICPKAGNTLGVQMSEESSKKKSLAMLGNKHTLGRKLTEEHKRKIGNKSKGHPVSDDQRKAVTDANSLWWEVTFPTGETVLVKNLRRFCKTNEVPITTLFHLASGYVQNNRRGWKCRRTTQTGVNS